MRDEAVFPDVFQDALQLIAPGTSFVWAFENILKARTGALLVVGDSPEVMDLVSGGFHLDCELTPSNLYELAKMDGAIVLNNDASRILVANTQLVPDHTLPSSETGIRHRTAERVARQTGELQLPSPSAGALLHCLRGLTVMSSTRLGLFS